MSKFSALPDIDDAPDVYESEPAARREEPLPDADEPDSENIAHPRVAPAEARKRFGGAVVDARNADFDGARGYRTASREVYEDDGDVESPAETLARLGRELARLKQRMGASAAVNGITGGEGRQKVLLDQARALEADLDGLELSRLGGMAGATDQAAQKSLMKQLAAFKEAKGATRAPKAAASEGAADDGPDGAKLTYELYLSPDSAASHQVSVLAEIDGRLASLEKLIGPAPDPEALILPSGGIQQPQPLLAAVEKMEQQLNLLTQPRALDVLAMKVRRLAADLDRIAEARTRLAVPSVEAAGSAASSRSPSPARIANAPGGGGAGSELVPASAIRSLFSTITTLQPLIPQIPQLLLRLRALQQVHADAVTLVDSVAAVSESQTKLDGEVRELKMLCSKLEESMMDNASLVEKNVETLGARIDGLKAMIKGA
ncbi:Dynamitin-domain-containing protein [Hyaloraphidium curvatum]|nr:Dynamitin-domain-containing protein [Hyaloraphidium curvatum]